MPRNRYNKAFNVKFTAEQFAMLGQLAVDSGVNKADIIRQAISNRFQQRYGNVAKCATGNACLCPNMHQVQNVPQHTDKELLKQVQEQDV